MTGEIAICLAILVGAIALFWLDRVPPEVVGLAVMLLLIATGLLSADKAFSGFGSDTVMMILGLLIMTAGLIQTGVVEKAGNIIFEIAGKSPARFLPLIMVAVACMSAFMSNTAATAFFVPLVIAYAARIKASASRFLLPVAFASLITSSVTLISTTTNIVVSDLMTKAGLAPMGMFELAPVGLPIAIVGILYVWLVGMRLLPERNTAVAEAIGERKYQADIIVLPESPAIGKPVSEARLGEVAVIKIVRGERKLATRGEIQSELIEAGDELSIEGLRADLLKIKIVDGFEIKADAHLADRDLTPDKLEIVEGVLLPGSPLIGRTLSNLNFNERYGLQVLGIHRAGRIPEKTSRARLRLGDVLLLQGTPEDVKSLERGNLFSIFGGVDRSRLNMTLAPLAILIFASAIAAAASRAVPLPVATLSGALAMLLSRCITPEEAYRQVEWKAIILIGSLLSLGAAMESTGTGRYIAGEIISLTNTQNPIVLMSIYFLLTVALTQPMSNQAAALVVLPVALATATQLGVDPRPFAMMVAVAASCSYLTPLEPSCLLVYGPGQYTLSDFLIVGLPLTVIIFVIAIVLVPVFWPL